MEEHTFAIRMAVLQLANLAADTGLLYRDRGDIIAMDAWRCAADALMSADEALLTALTVAPEVAPGFTVERRDAS